MSRKSTLEPRWLVSMLTAWVRYGLAIINNGLGYPNHCIYLAEKGVGGRNRSSDGISLNAYDKDDFEKVDEAMKKLASTRHELYAAVVMYYKPWTVGSLQAQGYPFQTRNYYYRLHDAHEILEEMLWEVESKYAKKQQNQEISEVS